MALDTSDYQLVWQGLGQGLRVLVLKKRRDERTFLEEMAADPRRRDETGGIVRALRRLLQNGVDWGFESGTLKFLQGTTDIALYELKAKAQTYRVMTYVHGGKVRSPILLCAFRAHQSKQAGGVLKQDRERGEELARIARNLMLAEEKGDQSD